MADCNNCGKWILFGGRKLDGASYCSTGCAARHPLLQMAGRVPADVLQQHVAQWRQGACPRCRQQGPIDVHAYHRVHSFVLMTQWHTRRSVCCRRCGRRSQLGAALYSVALGWWGGPWGLLKTPIQVGRNIAAMCRPAPVAASADFERVVRLQLAEHAVRAPALPQAD